MHLNTIFAPKAGWKVESMCVYHYKLSYEVVLGARETSLSP